MAVSVTRQSLPQMAEWATCGACSVLQWLCYSGSRSNTTVLWQGAACRSSKEESKLKYYDENFVNIVNQYEKCEAEASEQADWADSLAIPGEVYFADTKRVLPDLKKVGGTSKTGPIRVRQLSTAGVPEPYVCYRSIAVKDWRLMEKSIHEYFKEARVYPGKEFFLLSDKDVDTICDAIEGKIQMSDKEHANWTFSVRTARERLEKSRRKRFGAMQEDDADGLDTATGGDNGSTSAAGARELLEQQNTSFFSTKPSTLTSIVEPREEVVRLQCDTKLSRCYIVCYSAEYNLLQNLKIPKSGGGEYEIRCMISAYNAESSEARCYLELTEQVREKKLVDRMTAMGAKLACPPTTFSAKQARQKSSYDDECAASLFSVHQDSKRPGWTLVERGTPWVEPREMAQAWAGDAGDLDTAVQSGSNNVSTTCSGEVLEPMITHTCNGVANECENSQKTEQEESGQQMENSMLDSQSEVGEAWMHHLQASETERNKVGDDKFSVLCDSAHD